VISGKNTKEPGDETGGPDIQAEGGIGPPPWKEDVGPLPGLKDDIAVLRRVRWRKLAPEGVVVILAVWLAWLLFSPPTFTFPETKETVSCTPVAGRVDSYPLSSYPTSKKRAIDDYVDRAVSNIPVSEERTRECEVALRQASAVVIASCQDARANRQNEAYIIMIVITIIVIPRLCRRGGENTDSRHGSGSRVLGGADD